MSLAFIMLIFVWSVAVRVKWECSSATEVMEDRPTARLGPHLTTLMCSSRGISDG